MAVIGPRARVVAVALLVAVSPCTAAEAHAVSPPPVDSTLLPAAAPPAPAQPTVQREVCTVPTLDAQRASAPTQLDGLDLPTVWPLTRGDGQRVAVIDTGVAPHRRLPGLVAGGDYVSAGDGTRDCDGHGTVVAGIIAGRGDAGADRFSGVAPASTVIAIRQSSARFSATGDASRAGVGDVDTLAKAVRRAADLGASVINISAVACGSADSGLDDRALGAALAYAVDERNAVVVAAAGDSDGSGRCAAPAGADSGAVAVSPAWYDDYVLTVGSVTLDGAPSAFTRAGPWVDVAAPGEAVLSLSPVGDATANSAAGRHGPGPLAGTGYAAPVVSGLAALIRSRFPDWTPRQVMDRIKASAHHPPGGWDSVVGAGVVDPSAAVGTEPAPAPVAPAPHRIPAPQITRPPAIAESPDRLAALTGTAVLLIVLAATAVGRTALSRLRR